MATKQTKKVDENKVPDSAKTNGELDGSTVREPSVAEPVTTSFDERTGVTQPFLRADGSQDNGAEDLEEPEGARRETTREGNQTTVEDTKDAIEDGKLPASDQPDVDEEPAKNPVK